MPSLPEFQTLRLSCVMPAYNEAQSLPTVVPQVLQALRELAHQIELVLVNDGSLDATAQVARALCAQDSAVVLLEPSRNFGKEAALTAGLQTARGDVAILMDADGQHPTELLPLMMRKWREGMDVVYTVRQTREDQSALQARLTGWFYKLINWSGRIDIPADAGDFRLMDRRAVDALNAMPERNRFMKGLYAWVGFPSAAVRYTPLPRAAGKTRFGLRGALSLAITGMLAFPTVPLRLLALFGLPLSGIAMAYGAWVVAEHFFRGAQVPGFATIVVSVMFFSGIQLLALGVMAAYVGRIYEEVQQRPLYWVRARHGQGLSSLEEPRA